MKKIILILAGIVLCLAGGAQTLTPKQDAKKGKWGYVDASGKWAVKPKYDAAGPYERHQPGQSVAIVEEKGLKGFLNEAGKPLGDGIKYTEIIIEGANAPIVTLKNGKKGILSYDGTYYVKPEIDAITPVGADGYVVMIKGKAGLVGLDGSSRIEPKEFTGIEPFGDTGMWLVSKGDKKGVLRLGDKKPFIKCDFASISPEVEHFGRKAGYRVTSLKGGVGYVGTDGKDLCRPYYKQIMPMGDNQYYVVALSDDKYVWLPDEDVMLSIDKITINPTGPLCSYVFTLNPSWEKYSTLYRKEKEVAAKFFPTKSGSFITDGHGKRFLSVERVSGSDFYLAKSTDGYNLYKGKELLAEGLDKEPRYVDDYIVIGDEFFQPEGGRLVKADVRTAKYCKGASSGDVRKLYLIRGADGLYDVYSEDIYTYELKPLGMKVEDMKPESICDMVTVKKDGRWQLWNMSTGEKVTDCDEDVSLDRMGHVYTFKNNGKYGLIKFDYPYNYDVKLPAEYDRIVPLRGDYDGIEDFWSMAIVTKDGKSWVADYGHDREFSARGFEALEQSSCTRLDFIGTINGRKGIYAYDGTEKLAPKYDDIEGHKDDDYIFYLVTVNGKKGLVNGHEYKENIKPLYDELEWNEELRLYDAKRNSGHTWLSRAGREWSGKPEAIVDDWDSSSTYNSQFGFDYHKYLNINGHLLVRFAKNQPVKAVFQLTLNGKALPKFKETENFTPDKDYYKEYFAKSFYVWDKDWPLDKKGLGWIVTIYDMNGKVIGKFTKSFRPLSQ